MKKSFMCAMGVALCLAIVSQAGAEVIKSYPFTTQDYNGWGITGTMDWYGSGGNPGGMVEDGYWNNGTGKLYVESISAVGYTDIKVTWDMLVTGGDTELTTYYRLSDSGAWTEAEVLGVSAMNGYKGSWGSRTYSLPAAADGAAELEFMFEAWASSGSTVDFDNVVISGLPEPATFSLLGLASLLICRRRH